MRTKRKTFLLSLLVVAILASFLFAHEAKSRAEERIYDRVSSVTAVTEHAETVETLVKVAHAAEKPKAHPKSAPKPYVPTSELMAHWNTVMLRMGTVNREKLLQMIDCESDGVEDVVVWDVHSLSYGLLQFKTPTWESFSKKAGVTGSPLEGEKAIQVADWALSNGHGRHWTCF